MAITAAAKAIESFFMVPPHEWRSRIIDNAISRKGYTDPDLRQMNGNRTAF
jgi:hypothetical protein